MFKLVYLFAFFCYVRAEKCPSGGEIYARGISEQGKTDVVDAHNKYRLQIASGSVPKQPKGIDLKKMKYDVVLGEKGKSVSDTCKIEHVTATDDRWSSVGQNLFMTSYPTKNVTQDWNEVVAEWFSEHKNFVYPSTSNGMTGHYTQVVWADTEFVGCDFIAYYDTSEKNHAQLYTCNYGPPGNFPDTAPYKKGDSGCENLC